jgi:hypothetical protein
MSKFKVGDKVRRVRNGWIGSPIGFETVLWDVPAGPTKATTYKGVNQSLYFFDPDDWELIEPAHQGPVRTVTTTRKVIEPGEYEGVHVDNEGNVSVAASKDPARMRIAAKYLAEIAEVLEGWE